MNRIKRYINQFKDWYKNLSKAEKTAIITGIFAVVVILIEGLFGVVENFIDNSKDESTFIVQLIETPSNTMTYPNVTNTSPHLSTSSITPTPKPSLTPSPTITESPSPTQPDTSTYKPRPECSSAEVQSLVLFLNPSLTIKPDNNIPITLTNNQTSGLNVLKGKATFSDSNVNINCNCSWKGETEPSIGSLKNIGTDLGDCSFSLPLSGSEKGKEVHLLLYINGQLNKSFTIKFP